MEILKRYEQCGSDGFGYENPVGALVLKFTSQDTRYSNITRPSQSLFEPNLRQARIKGSLE